MKLGEEEGSLALDRERIRITKLLTDRKIILDLTVLLMSFFLYFPRRSRKDLLKSTLISQMQDW
jgi:hypothetical protein